jgi:hypothetical protein
MRLYLRDLCGLRLNVCLPGFPAPLEGAKPTARIESVSKAQRDRMEGAMMVENTVVRGLVAGLAGVAAMTATEKLEQAFTRRPNSYVPAHTLERLSPAAAP